MATVSLILLFAAISYLDLPHLLRQRKKRELLVYSVLLLSAFILSEMQILRIEMWSPNRIITEIVHTFQWK
ncbi:hypothetical protein [Brevibacillus sp. SYSU BS000544]|uniref:hypothetical protein n=1 Tax=Brevibacillus sp. SYSU BS000544 TaxID=3416443 RepID=UPI003CE54CF0